MGNDSRCTGHCCRGFSIRGKNYEQLKIEYEAWLRSTSGDEQVDSMSAGFSRSSYREKHRFSLSPRSDIHIVFPMLIPLGKMRQSPLKLINQTSLPEGAEGIDMYTCKHLDKGGSCSIYDNRPLMCRQYGLGQTCEYEDCTWEGHKETPRPALGKFHAGNELKAKTVDWMDEPISIKSEG